MLARLSRRLFDLRPGEGRRVALLYLLMFIGGSGTAWARSVVEAEFLHHVGVEYLPWLLVASAIASAISIALYGAFADRASNGAIYLGINILAALGIAGGLMIDFGGNTPAAYAALALVMAVSVDIGNLHWATYVNGFYDTQSAKRIFPIVTSAARMAAIFAGATTPLLTSSLSSSAIVALRAATLLIAGAIAVGLPRLAPIENPPPADKRATRRSYGENIVEGLSYVRRSSYLGWIALSTLTMTLILALASYQTSAVLLRELKSAKAIADFLGLLNAITNAAMMPFFAIWLSRIIRRLGVAGSALIFPIGNGIFTSMLGFFPSVATAGLEYFGRTTFRITFQFTIDGLLFNAVALHVRARARAFIVGLLVPAGVLAGGSLLLVLRRDPELIKWFLLGGSVVYFLAAWKVRQGYGRALMSLLEARDYSSLLAEPAPDLGGADRATVERLEKQFVENTDPKTTVLLAELYARAAGPEALAWLSREAQLARDPEIRAGIVEALEATEAKSADLSTAFFTFTRDEDARVRRAAFGGWRRVAPRGDKELAKTAERLLGDDDREVRSLAISIVLRSTNPGAAVRASRALEQMLASTDAAQRSLGARIVGEIRALDRLVLLAIDEDQTVRAEAVSAIARIAPKAQVELLLRAMEDRSPAVWEPAVEGLVRVGAAVIPEIERRLRNPREPEQRAIACFVLARLAVKRARPIWRALAAEEVRAIAARRPKRLALGGAASGAERTLFGVLRERDRRALDRIFLPVSAVHGAAALAVIRRSLASADVRVRADAVDVIETSFGAELAGEIAAAVRDQPVGLDVREPMSVAEVIEELTGDSDPDVREIARLALGKGSAGEGRSMLSIIERMIHLKSVSLFESLTLDQLRAMAALTEERTFEPGQRIIEQGSPGDSLCVLVSGRVGIEQTREGKAIALRSLEAPACVGEMSLFDGMARSASVVAEQDTVILELGREPVLALARRHPDLALQIVEVLSQRLRSANERISQLQPNDERV